ncbi:hypothetical protein Ahy_A10g047750 [Arachis hypogaea]|uniref:Protein FAR1-RELATED SEQUENCE n=1 Tax=Arachis hypogaea TaxID=3818 RepID=A0A445B3C2_ARAHY|nr:hypothetical protein Ahy_A10g047750 [Arachis hypogaea]
MLKQHRQLSMSVRCTIENNEEARIRPSKTYQSFVAAAGGHRSREQRKRESDAAYFHTVIPCATKSLIEAQFQHMYTYEKFREVQAQFRGKVNYITGSTQSALGYMVYVVVKQVSNSIFNKFAIIYDTISSKVKCQCLLFESRRILCRHSLSALSFERVNKVSPRYILEQWSKNVKRRHTHIKSSNGEPLLEPRSRRFDDLVFRLQNVCEFALESEELTGILHRAYDNAMVEMQEHKAKSKRKCSLCQTMLSWNTLTSFKAPHELEQEDVQKIDWDQTQENILQMLQR